jgi:hypothetical protein
VSDLNAYFLFEAHNELTDSFVIKRVAEQYFLRFQLLFIVGIFNAALGVP